MKFAHLRNAQKALKATIPYEKIDDKIYYGVSVVSNTEPQSKVNYKIGRGKASGRCGGAIKSKKIIRWNNYYNKKVKVDGMHDKHFDAIIWARFNKLGSMPEQDFVDMIPKLRKAILELC